MWLVASRCHIHANSVLNDLTGLSGITSLGELNVSSNGKLTNLNGLTNVIGIEENLEVYNNEVLSDCRAISRLLDEIDDPPPGPGPGTAGIPDIGGNVYLNANASGCNSITEIFTVFKDGFEGSE